MTGPLVPMPSLPHYSGTGVAVERDTTMVKVAVDNGAIPFAQVTATEAPALAAAILAAAGLDTHRVIDLGDELPEVDARSGELVTVSADGVTRTWDEAYAQDGSAVLRDVIHGLALLEARAATLKHDPAELAAVADVIGDMSGDGAAPEVTARAVLDALAAVRSEATP